MEERDALKKLASEREEGKSDSAKETKSTPSPPPRTWVDDVFGGELQWSTTCQECNSVSVMVEPFMDISLPVPAPPKV
eukprot:1117971-Prorocentrum_minimum.AAC.1